jgi:hypothetical protein
MSYGKIYETSYWGSRNNSIDWAEVYKDLGVDADYQAVLDKAISLGYALPIFDHLVLQNLFVKELKDKAIWDELDLLYLFAVSTEDNTSNFTRLNLKSPSAFLLGLTNAPTWTANQGWSNSGTSRLTTGFTLDTDGVNYTKDDAGSFAAFPLMDSSSQTNNRIYGNDGSSNYLSPRLDVDGSDTGNRSWLNSTQYQEGSGLELDIHKDNNVIFFQNRTESTEVNYRSTDLVANDTKSGTDTSSITSATLRSEDLELLGARTAGGAAHMKSGNTMGLFGFGGSLTATKMADLETAWYTNYFTKLI